MSRDLKDLLQHCLSAFASGSTPEECLAAFPEEREALEPLLRQAICLRVAFTTMPSEEYRSRARDRLLFAGGRDVKLALASAPAADFVQDGRQRLLLAAGSAVREALLAVPPPRLPFWLNARRRLLDAAGTPRPAFQPMAFVMRAGLSVAAVVAAIAIAGTAYLTTHRQPTSVGAELASVEQQLNDIEQRHLLGQPIPASAIVDLTKQTNDLAGKLNDAQAAPVAEKLPAIIERQQRVVAQVVADNPAPLPALQQAQQQLDQADDKLRLFAARVEQATASTSAQAQDVSPTDTPTPSPTPAAPATATPIPQPLLPGQVQVRLLPNDTTAGAVWQEVRTSEIRLVAPASWRLVGISVNANGVAALTGDFLGFDGSGVIVLVNVHTGETNSLIGGQELLLRTGGPAGDTIGAEQLLATGGAYALVLRHFADSVELTARPIVIPPPLPPLPTASATPSVTPASVAPATSTPSPTPTATSTPKATATATPTVRR